jgi:short-subunit dehydrogenase
MCLSEELKDSNVHVAVVYPGTMMTNKFVRARIKKHNNLVKAGVVPTDIVASVSLKKLFNMKRVILVGWANYLMWFLMMITPPYLKLKLITNAMRQEVSRTTTATEISS